MFPFIGLSILVHISIIIFFNIFHITPSNWQKIRQHRRLNTVLGSAIILSVVGFALVSAFFLVRASVDEKHSTLVFLEEHDRVLANIGGDIYSVTLKVNPALAQ